MSDQNQQNKNMEEKSLDKQHTLEECEQCCGNCQEAARSDSSGQLSSSTKGTEMKQKENASLPNQSHSDIHFDMLQYQDYLTYDAFDPLDRIHLNLLFRRYR